MRINPFRGAGTSAGSTSSYPNNQAQFATGLGANVGVGLGVGIASSNYPYYPSQTGSNTGATVIPTVTGAVASNMVPAVTGTVGTVLGGVIPIVSQVG